MAQGTGHSAAIVGCAGLELDDAERALFRASDPLGFILFARNIETPDQVRALVGELRDCVGRSDAMVLIDQEGGRVARLPSPPWRAAPPAAGIGELFSRDLERGREAAWLNGRLIAHDLAGLGINVDCLPVLDLRIDDAHDIIGDRAFGGDPRSVASLGRSTCDGLLAGGVLPVVKHVPGHGRAALDSHKALPVVDTPRETLEKTDFVPFRELADMPVAMTAHVVYSAIDPDAPATTSPTVVGEVIRGFIGFDGLLLSDDLSMQALTGNLDERARAALAAGCDVALHCNGDPDEMAAVLDACGPLSDRAAERAARALDCLHDPAPVGDAKTRYAALMPGGGPHGA